MKRHQLHAFEKRTCREELPLRVPDRNKRDEISFFHKISTSSREKERLSDFFIDVFLQILETPLNPYDVNDAIEHIDARISLCSY